MSSSFTALVLESAKGGDNCAAFIAVDRLQRQGVEQTFFFPLVLSVRIGMRCSNWSRSWRGFPCDAARCCSHLSFPFLLSACLSYSSPLLCLSANPTADHTLLVSWMIVCRAVGSWSYLVEHSGGDSIKLPRRVWWIRRARVVGLFFCFVIDISKQDCSWSRSSVAVTVAVAVAVAVAVLDLPTSFVWWIDSWEPTIFALRTRRGERMIGR